MVAGGSAGNSGTVTLSSGPGGAASGGSAAGASGNVFLKTGVGGGNAQPSSTGGNAGHIILQPGNGGSAATQGAGGSTLVRASNSGDILAVQNSAGSTTHLAVNNSGNLRIGTASSAARLHLGGGTLSLPPLKFDSGSLLTSPATGSLEWNGTEFYRTNANGRRPLGTDLELANVFDFGAKGDGTTDDRAVFQAAVDSLANVMQDPPDGRGPGGIIWLPPGHVYAIGNKVIIRCRNPIWIISAMAGKGLGGGAGTTHPESAQIRPLNNMDYIFEWDLPSGDQIGQEGGGGIQGLHIADLVLDNSSPIYRTKTLTAAVHIKNAISFHINDCFIEWIKGSAIQVGTTTLTKFWNLRINTCGDGDARPAFDLNGSIGYVWGQRLFMENNAFGLYPNVATMAPAVRVNASCLLDVDGCYFENSNSGKAITNAANNGSGLIRITSPGHGLETSNFVYIHSVGGTTEANGIWVVTVIDSNTFDLQGSSFANAYTSGGKAEPHGLLRNDQVFIDASEGGEVSISNGRFNANELTSVILGFTGALDNCSFDNAPSGAPTIQVLSTASRTHFQQLDVIAGGVTGTTLDIQADGCILDSIYLKTTGRVDASGTQCILSNISMFQPTADSGTYAIDLANGNHLHNAHITGNNISTCHGIRVAGGLVSGCVVRDLNSGNGIASTSANDVVTGNYVANLNGGTPFTWTQGATAKGNKRYQTTASDGDNDDAITLNSETGLLTTKSLTTAAGGTYLLILNNSLITSTTRLNVTVGRGAGMTQGFPQLLDVQIISGQAFIRILNQDLGTGAFNAPVNVFFAIDN